MELLMLSSNSCSNKLKINKLVLCTLSAFLNVEYLLFQFGLEWTQRLRLHSLAWELNLYLRDLFKEMMSRCFVRSFSLDFLTMTYQILLYLETDLKALYRSIMQVLLILWKMIHFCSTDSGNNLKERSI